MERGSGRERNDARDRLTLTRQEKKKDAKKNAKCKKKKKSKTQTTKTRRRPSLGIDNALSLLFPFFFGDPEF